MAPGVAGAELTVTDNVLAVLEPQELSAVTLTFPLVLPIVAVIEFVPEPAVIAHPEGKDQVYPVAPETAATL